MIQDIHQLATSTARTLRDSFAGQCDAIFSFAPGEWQSAEWMSKRAGERDVITCLGQ